MTNIIRNKKVDDVQSHINKAYVFINQHLPQQYVSKVKEKSGDKYSAGTIRNLRHRTNPKPENNLELLNILVDVARENKSELAKLKRKL